MLEIGSRYKIEASMLDAAALLKLNTTREPYIGTRKARDKLETPEISVYEVKT